MRYALQLLPDAFLLLALLRMTYVGLAVTRRAMFFFLCVWLVYSFVVLFLGQIWKAESREYALWYFSLSLPAWICSLLAVWQASQRLSKGNMMWVLGILAMAGLASRFAVLNVQWPLIAKLLAVNCWVAIVAGSVFALASIGAEGADLYLWRCTGVFLLVFGFGLLLIGMVRPGPRAHTVAYTVWLLAGATVWFALAWLIGPRPEHLWNPEKLAIVPAALFRLRWAALRQVARVGNDTGEHSGPAED